MSKEHAPKRRKPVDRAQVLRVAARLFREQGFHGTSMQDIGEALGLLKGSLYYHIKSKDEVLFELLNESVTDVRRRVEAAAKTTSEPVTRLRTVLRVEILAMADHLDEISIWLGERSRLQSQFPEIARAARAVDRILLRVLEDGHKQDAWSLSNPTLAFFAIRDMTASFVTWFDPRGAITSDEVADAYARYALHIVLGETEHARPRAQVRAATSG